MGHLYHGYVSHNQRVTAILAPFEGVWTWSIVRTGGMMPKIGHNRSLCIQTQMNPPSIDQSWYNDVFCWKRGLIFIFHDILIYIYIYISHNISNINTGLEYRFFWILDWSCPGTSDTNGSNKMKSSIGPIQCLRNHSKRVSGSTNGNLKTCL